MLGRRILRMKAFKVLYGYAVTGKMTLDDAMYELDRSCEATRDLYLFMLAIISPLTKEARGIQFNLINIVISTFIFGIGVDYSIFVMEGLLTEARTGTKNLLESHKMAIFFSAFVLMVVVVALLFAKHPSIHSIGVSTLIGMAATILITYTLEPFLFRQFMKWKRFRNKVVNHCYRNG